MELHLDPGRRHDFLLLFDCKDGNPNGDPDNANMPRVDPETGEGLVSDVCLKRKVRDYVALVAERDGSLAEQRDRLGIYVRRRAILSNIKREAFEKTNQKPSREDNEAVRQYMCEHYYDVRLFGGVLSAGKVRRDEAQRLGVPEDSLWSAGQIIGPVQMTFARSIGPVLPLSVAITRVALENASDIERRGATEPEAETGGDEIEARAGQMGAKALLPYGLYRAYGFFSPAQASKTGVTSQDLGLLWDALVNCWEHDRSSARGMMSCRGLYIFTHKHPLGDAPAHSLFEVVQIERLHSDGPARSFTDFRVTVNPSAVPEGVSLLEEGASLEGEGRVVRLTRLAA